LGNLTAEADSVADPISAYDQSVQTLPSIHRRTIDIAAEVT
jgi:hypothetical protein